MTQSTQAGLLEPAPGSDGTARPALRPVGGGRRVLRALAPLPWITPATALILFVVIWPVVSMFLTSRQHFDSMGFDQGSAGWSNFTKLFDEPDLPGVLVRTVVWVVAVVGLTILISLGVAQMFNKQFPGRKVARWALIAPWAASVVMTSIVFKWMLNPSNGTILVLMHDLGFMKDYNSVNWLSQQTPAFIWEIVVAIFVSVPFTTYALLAGLQAVPDDVYEASRLDGAGAVRTYWSITLPLLRPALLVAALINIMNVFNSFPIIYEMTGGGPGNQTSTTTLFMYNTQQTSIGEAAAMSVVNFGFIIVVVLLFLRASRWNSAED